MKVLRGSACSSCRKHRIQLTDLPKGSFSLTFEPFGGVRCSAPKLMQFAMPKLGKTQRRLIFLLLLVPELIALVPLGLHYLRPAATPPAAVAPATSETAPAKP